MSASAARVIDKPSCRTFVKKYEDATPVPLPVVLKVAKVREGAGAWRRELGSRGLKDFLRREI